MNSDKTASASTKNLSATTNGEIVEVKFTWAIQRISFLLHFSRPIFSSRFKLSEDSAWSWYCSIIQEDASASIPTSSTRTICARPSQAMTTSANKTLKFGLSIVGDFRRHGRPTIPAEFQFSALGPKGEISFTGPNYGMYEEKQSTHHAESSLTRSKLLEQKTDPGDVLTVVCQVRVYYCSTPDILPLSPCRMQQDMESMLKDATFADVTLVVEDHRIPAHKAILAARSPVFAAMFSADMVETKENQVNISDMEYDVMQHLLRFVYTGKAPEVEPQSADRLLVAADKYGLMRLKEMCERAVSETLTLSTVVKTLIFADRMNAEHLKFRAMAFIKANLNKVMDGKDWKRMSSEHPAILQEIYRRLWDK